MAAFSRSIAAATILFFVTTASNADEVRRFPDRQHIGSWTTVEGLVLDDGMPWTNGIVSKSRTLRRIGCNGTNDECALQFTIECTAQRYALTFYGPCSSCGHMVAGPTIVRVNFSSGYGFNVQGFSDDDGFVKAPLTDEQVAEISQMEWTSIGVGAQGRGYIYTPTTGTAAAFAALAAGCSPAVKQ